MALVLYVGRECSGFGKGAAVRWSLEALARTRHSGDDAPVRAQGEQQDPGGSKLTGLPAGKVLLVSGFGDESSGGGIFSWDGTTVERIDRISTTALVPGEGRLYRGLRDGGEADVTGEVLAYDTRGVLRYWRLDSLGDLHDLLPHEGHLVAVSSWGNSIQWLSPSGEVVRTWRAPGDGDAWHLNCLAARDSELYVSAFGKSRVHRGWANRLVNRTGFLMHLWTQEEVLQGLSHPHTPRFLDGHWVICNSATRELFQFSTRSATPTRAVSLAGYTRGIAVTDDCLYVGESARRGDGGQQCASVAILSRCSWELLGRFHLPCQEVYDLAIVPSALAEGVRAGFRTNATRVRESGQAALFEQVGIEPQRLWATGDPLPAEVCRIRLICEVPAIVGAGVRLEVPYVLENRGGAFLVSAPPNPTRAAYRWFDARSGNLIPNGEGVRSALRTTLPPGGRTSGLMVVVVPEQPGTYLLRATLVQEFVAWFDDIDLANASCHEVTVVVAPRDGGRTGDLHPPDA